MNEERYARFRWRLGDHDEAGEIAYGRSVERPVRFNRPPGEPDDSGIFVFEDGRAIAPSSRHKTRHPDIQPAYYWLGELEPDSEWRPAAPLRLPAR